MNKISKKGGTDKFNKKKLERLEKLFNKELPWLKKMMNIFRASLCWICDNGYADDDVKVRDNCQVTGKYRGSAYRD